MGRNELSKLDDLELEDATRLLFLLFADSLDVIPNNVLTDFLEKRDLRREDFLGDWSHVEPSIFGALYEDRLDPKKRSRLGAYFTPIPYVEKIVNSVIVEPFLKNTGNLLEEVRNFKVLDPACGSGNFLYIALQKLLDLEISTGSKEIRVNPSQVLGIELDPYAAKLARITVWVAYLQWIVNKGFKVNYRPPTNSIINDDALLINWPKANVVIGNPPFIGARYLKRELGSPYVEKLKKLYPSSIDFSGYWILKTLGNYDRAGFVVTSSIAEGANKKILEDLLVNYDIYNAYKDEPWGSKGAKVRVSLICYAKKGTEEVLYLEGAKVKNINPNLTSGPDLSKVRRLEANIGRCFRGVEKNGPFDIGEKQAMEFLANPINAEVIKPKMGGIDLVGKDRDLWIIDFADISLEGASMYEGPFKYVKKHVKPVRDLKNGKLKEFWWQFVSSYEKGYDSYIVSPVTSKHRIFDIVDGERSLDNTLIILEGDLATFGVLQSKFHEIWSSALGGSLEERFSYRIRECFDTFPFPEDYSSVAEVARNFINVRKEGLENRTLTQLYNVSPTWLQELHQKLDIAVAKAYGVGADLDREEVLEFLLNLNLQNT